MNKEIKNNFNLKFKLLDNKNIFKDKINIILDKTYNSNVNNNKEFNKSKGEKEFSIFNPNYKEAISYIDKKNDILLLEQKIKKKSHHPIFLSLMTNKNNFSEKKFKIENINKNNNIEIKTNSTKNIPNIKFDNFNNNNKYNLKNKNNNNKSINSNNKHAHNMEKFKLDFSKIKEISKSSINIYSNPKRIKNENIFKKKNFLNEHSRNQINIFNRKGLLNANNSLNTSINDNYTIIPDKNIFKQQQQLSSSILIPLENKSNIDTIGYNIKPKKKDFNSFNINDFMTKDIKDKNIKKLLLLSLKETENKSKNNIETKKLFKLKDIHNFPTISLIEETQKNKNNNKQTINIISNSNTKMNKNKSNNNKNNKNLNSDRLIFPYKLKNKNTIIDYLNKPINNMNNIINMKNKKEKETKINVLTNNIINNNNIGKNEINENQNKNNNNVNNNNNLKSKIKKKLTIIKGKNKKESNQKNNIKNNNNNKNKIINNNKFLDVFNIKKTKEINSNSKFLNFIYIDISQKCENFMNIVKSNKLSVLVKSTNIINNIISNEQIKLKKYIHDIKNNLKVLKDEIFNDEIKINIDDNYNIIKNKIFFYILSSSYILSFKKFNLSILFSNYVFKFINFSSIYLPIVKNKNTHKRQALVVNDNLFSVNLSNSLYPEIKSKYLNSSNPEKLINFLSNMNLIIRLINIDIDESINDIEFIEYKDSIKKINESIEINQKNHIKNNNMDNTIKKRKAIKDLSFMPQLTIRNSNNIYNKICSKRRASCSYININFKKNYFPHSVLDKKQFFDVPERIFNIKLNSTISKAILYTKMCDKKIEDMKKDKNKIIKDLINEDRNLDELINRQCIEKLRICINNAIKGKKNLGDHYNILKEIKGQKYIEETLRMLITEGQETLFLDYLDKNYRNINLNCLDENNNTFLILSVKEGLENIVKALLEKNVEINIKNKNGNTALHYALGNKMFYIADLLKNYGADETILNKNGLTPWECLGKSGFIKNYN